LDNSPHECRPSQQPSNKNTFANFRSQIVKVKEEKPGVDEIIQKPDKNKITLEELDKRLKKVEYTLFGE
jgi:hypothetical protein